MTTDLILEGNRVVELRFKVSLPARGRTILGRHAFDILGVNLPHLVNRTLLYRYHYPADLEAHVQCAENQQYLRSQLSEKGLVAFIANGAILPRTSGVSSRPLDGEQIVPFQAPPSLEITLCRTHGKDVQGME